MTLHNFVTSLKRDIDAFERMWVENHDKDPELYPSELTGPTAWGDWHEQFLAWANSRDEDTEAP